MPAFQHQHEVNKHLQSGALEAYQSAAQQDKQKCPFEQLPHREGYQGEQN